MDRLGKAFQLADLFTVSSHIPLLVLFANTILMWFYQDTDFEYLYDNSYDGIEETELAQRMGISSLAFHEWFFPFSDEPSRTPYPYIREDDSPKP